MITIDASLANKLVFSQEEDHKEAQKILQNHISGKEVITVPDLLFYEVANTLATKSGLSSWKITHSLNKIYSANFDIYHPTEDDVKGAMKMAQRYGTSVYDMLYAILARKHKTILVTADERFVKATKFRFVKLLKDIS